MARLIIKSTESPAQVIELRTGLNRFGRSADNDHLVVDPSVSDRHCEVLVEGDFVFVRDLGSTNGTFVNKQPVKETALYTGQVLQIGPVEMILDAPVAHLSLPELPIPQQLTVTTTLLRDGYAACLNHGGRHAIWECTDCHRCYCDQCVRKLRRVGGAYIKLCAACSHPTELSPWAVMMKKKKRSVFGKLVGKIKNSFKNTKQLFTRNDSLPPQPPGAQPRA
ncbi:MAG: domain containing protein [Pedosphaera sp.]|nr:domain containing protein [Pedosphaera sp.]